MFKRYLSVIICIMITFICCMVISCDCKSSNPPTNSDSIINSIINTSEFDPHMGDDKFPEYDFD